MNSKSLFSLLLLIVYISSAYSQKSDPLFAYWKSLYGKTYQDDNENMYRQTIFFENYLRMKQHNANPEKTYVQTQNQFSDLTQEEFISKILTPTNSGSRRNLREQTTQNISPLRNTQSLATSIDWKEKGAISSVKNQGTCAAWWAFSAISLMESQNYLASGHMIDLSEQQLIDCVNADRGYYSNGCQSGKPYEGYDFALRYGVKEEQYYSYTGVQGDCKTPQKVNHGYFLHAYYFLFSTVEAFQTQLQQTPLSVTIDASNWQFYGEGLFNDCDATANLNHGVNVYGYDENGNWLIKNSWGTSWGESGFMRLQAGDKCGILSRGYYILY